jgi:hypothetical protein
MGGAGIDEEDLGHDELADGEGDQGTLGDGYLWDGAHDIPDDGTPAVLEAGASMDVYGGDDESPEVFTQNSVLEDAVEGYAPYGA